MKLRSAFTLIELLIVVAIIAILAAIAVPNFLEAQTRAKATRARADHRTISTAMESYYVDHNRYPAQGEVTTGTYPYMTDTTKVFGGDGPDHAPNNKAIAFQLSTPIAYLSSTTAVFADPFFRAFRTPGTNVVNDTRFYNYSGDYWQGRIYQASSDGSVTQFEATSKALQQAAGWHLRSRGPDGDYEARSNGWADVILYRGQAGAGTSGNGGLNAIYDPTNGTASGGDIARFSKGRNFN
jgi:prepilin-type N-terminal cleavage/methylation domain-containing protein